MPNAAWSSSRRSRPEGRYGGYPGAVAIAGRRPSVPDRDKLAEMLKAGSAPCPDRLVWAMSDDVLKHFYWVEAPRPDPIGPDRGTVNDNTITLKTEHQDEVVLWLDSPLVDLARPVVVERDGRRETFTPRPSPETFCEGRRCAAIPSSRHRDDQIPAPAS